jgi:hypothetical protein
MESQTHRQATNELASAAAYFDLRCTVCPRFRAVLLACRDNAARETELFGSRFIAFNRALPRFVEPY